MPSLWNPSNNLESRDLSAIATVVYHQVRGTHFKRSSMSIFAGLLSEYPEFVRISLTLVLKSTESSTIWMQQCIMSAIYVTLCTLADPPALSERTTSSSSPPTSHTLPSLENSHDTSYSSSKTISSSTRQTLQTVWAVVDPTAQCERRRIQLEEQDGNCSCPLSWCDLL